ncbi:MAG: hypothetical protein JSW64_05295 [Candidatus Zixiibacteriota bacterium]|nr:MAG: hypothetical protein JSW64_05295 [candidate division Zixibacteria bacterium]
MKDISIAGEIAYVANSYLGLKILDISERLNPVELAEFTTSDEALNVLIADGKIFLIDESPRLFVLEYEP